MAPTRRSGGVARSFPEDNQNGAQKTIGQCSIAGSLPGGEGNNGNLQVRKRPDGGKNPEVAEEGCRAVERWGKCRASKPAYQSSVVGGQSLRPSEREETRRAHLAGKGGRVTWRPKWTDDAEIEKNFQQPFKGKKSGWMLLPLWGEKKKKEL